MSFFRVMIFGNLGKDPEAQSTQSGLQVSNFSVAWNESYKSEKPSWANVTAFDKTADFCNKYLQKGAKVIIDGRLQIDEWQDKKTGEQKKAFRVIADRVEAVNDLSGQKNGGGNAYGNTQQYPPRHGYVGAAPAATMPAFNMPVQGSQPPSNADSAPADDIPF